MKKSKNFNILIFSKSCDFAGFAKEKRLYLGKVTTDFERLQDQIWKVH
jgi:hypothetical protein